MKKKSQNLENGYNQKKVESYRKRERGIDRTY